MAEEKRSKQVIVMRKDLNMRKGKMVAQGAHASMKAILDRGRTENSTFILYKDKGCALQDWLDGLFTKVCVSVDSEAEMLEIYNKAKAANLPCALITDAGLTEFNGVPTKTCIAIGPAWAEEVDALTGHLKLL